MIAADEIERRIKDKMPDATVTVEDLTGGGDHYRVSVVSTQFADASLIERHRMVYASFDDVMGGALHALSIEARTPDE